jgi:hypothetical protein
MLGLQFGQFHVASLLLSVAAMICFEERRPAVGGSLLAVATVSKLFPAFLLVYLLARRRWREVAWTIGACVVFSLVGLAVLGWTPFEAFLSYQLPRIQSGEAFSFYEDKELVVSRNLGIPGLVTKLHFLGVPGMTHAPGCARGPSPSCSLLATEAAPSGIYCTGSLSSTRHAWPRTTRARAPSALPT